MAERKGMTSLLSRVSKPQEESTKAPSESPAPKANKNKLFEKLNAISALDAEPELGRIARNVSLFATKTAQPRKTEDILTEAPQPLPAPAALATPEAAPVPTSVASVPATPALPRPTAVSQPAAPGMLAARETPVAQAVQAPAAPSVPPALASAPAAKSDPAPAPTAPGVPVAPLTPLATPVAAVPAEPVRPAPEVLPPVADALESVPEAGVSEPFEAANGQTKWTDQMVIAVRPNGQTKRSDHVVGPDGQTKNILPPKPLTNTRQQKAVFGYLAANPDIITSVSNLSEILSIPPATLRKTLHLFERAGKIKKSCIGNDGLKIVFCHGEWSDQTVRLHGQTTWSDQNDSKINREESYLSISLKSVELTWPNLHRVGFGPEQIEQFLQNLAAQKKPADRVTRGLDHAEWELEHGCMTDKAGQAVADPCSWVFTSLARTGYYRRPPGYVSPEEQAARDAEQEARAITQAKKLAENARFEACATPWNPKPWPRPWSATPVALETPGCAPTGASVPPAAREGRRPSLDPPHRGDNPPGPPAGRSTSIDKLIFYSFFFFPGSLNFSAPGS